ncbi:MAG: N-acetylmuramoyl-L-alanine amidase [Pseudomonadota bacterium]
MPLIVPKTWMPKATIKRIHLHWTAGGHKANSVDKKAYHILVEGDGKLVRGTHSIADNASPRPSPRRSRAAHTRNANTGAIGVSLCAMRKSKERPFDPGPSPLTREQWDVGMQVLADLAEKYGVLVTPQTILTHAEVQANLGIKQKNKWDITRLAFDDDVSGHAEVGELMRSQVAALLDGRDSDDGPVEPPEEMKLPRFRVTGVAPSTLNFRDAPNGDKKGSLPERSIVEQIAVVGRWWQVRTRAGFVGWVFSDFLTPV